jgi:hypothetical protein
MMRKIKNNNNGSIVCRETRGINEKNEIIEFSSQFSGESKKVWGPCQFSLSQQFLPCFRQKKWSFSSQTLSSLFLSFVTLSKQADH